jgi:predicted DNA-binding antitoxin AbrB/MazE fold protein
MTKAVEAVYEGGVLRPLEALDLRERQRVRVVLQAAPSGAPGEEDWLDAECLRECAAEADERVSLESVRRALAKIPGSLTADFVQERDDR